MRYATTIALAIGALLTVGCGAETEKSHGAADNRVGSGEQERTTPPAPAKAEPRAEALPVENQISTASGTAGITADGGPATGPGVVKLSWAEPEAVSGNLELAGVTYQVHGYKREAALRCWLTFLGEEPNKTRRGVLLGTVTGKSITGTFTIAGNGGDSPVNGTWSAKM